MNADRLLIEFDKALRTLFAPATSARENPGSKQTEAELSEVERAHASALMRINHVGEVCAQALYQGQSLTCRDPELRQALATAANEETEHLAWTENRLIELGGRTSLLNRLDREPPDRIGRANQSAESSLVRRRADHRNGGGQTR